MQSRVAARPTAGPTFVTSIPFATRRVYHLDGRGGIWYGYSSEFRVIHATWDGQTLREITLDAPPVPVSQEEMDIALGEVWEPFVRAGGRVEDGMIPEVEPYFHALYVDPEGYLWVSVVAQEGRARFAVFDPEGRFLGHLEFDGVGDVRPIGPVVRNERIHLVGRDNLGVDRLFVFRPVR